MGCSATTLQCRHAFGVLFPLRASLRKELGEQLLSTGLVGAAMGVFQEEELWDSLIICYRLLQKLPQAQELVQARLQVCHVCWTVQFVLPPAAVLGFKLVSCSSLLPSDLAFAFLCRLSWCQPYADVSTCVV